MSLPDEQILPVCYFWAKRLCNKTVSFDELVNEAYAVAKKLNTPLLLQKWVKWTMIHLVEKTLPFSAELPDAPDTSFDFQEFTDLQEDLMQAVRAVCNESEQHLLYLLFWKGLSYRKAAKELKIPFQTVSYRVQKVLKDLREYYERRSRQ